MALTWNQSHIFDSNNFASFIPPFYLKDKLRKQAVDISLTESVCVFPDLVSDAFVSWLQNTDDERQLELFSYFTKSLSSWIDRIDAPSVDDKVCMLDAILRLFNRIHIHVKPGHSEKIIELGAHWINATFPDALGHWLDTINTDFFTDIDWRHFSHLAVMSQTARNDLLLHYESMWSTLCVNNDSNMSMHSRSHLNMSLQRLILGISINTPEKIDQLIDFIASQIVHDKDRLTLVAQEHLDWIQAHRDPLLSSNQRELASVLQKNQTTLTFLNAYRNVSSFGLHSPPVEEILNYTKSSWMRNQILSDAVETKHIITLLNLCPSLHEKRDALESIIGPLLKSSGQQRSYRQGLFHGDREEQIHFYGLYTSEDLGVRLLCASYMLSKFNIYDPLSTPYPKRVKKDGTFSIFRKASDILSTVVPEVSEAWKVFSDLHHADILSPSENAIAQSSFLWDYYQQHFGCQLNPNISLSQK